MSKFLFTAAVIIAAAPALAQAPVDEFDFKVNSGTTGLVFYSQVAAHPNGDFVVVWSARYGKTDGRLTGQRFGRDGQRRGAEFLVATSTLGFPRPAVSAAADGSFEVAWFTDYQDTLQIFTRRYDAAGAAGPVFRISPSTSTFDGFPSIATDSGGASVVAWESFVDGAHGVVRARRLDAGGVPLGADFAVNTPTTSYRILPAVRYLPGGDFVVVWSREAPDGIDSAVLGQRFSGAGTPLGSPFEVARSTTRPQRGASIATSPAGEFVVSWVDSRTPEDTVDRIKTRRFSAAGTPLGPERIAHLVPVDEIYLELSPPLALSRNDVVTVWGSNTPRELALRMRRFDAAGLPKGPAFDPVAGSIRPSTPDLAADGPGRVVATWVDVPHDARARRFGLMGPVALAVDPTAGSSSDGNGVLEPDEIVDLRPTWQSNDEVSRTPGGFLGEFSGPPGASYLAIVTNVAYPTFQPGAIQSPLLPYRVTVTAPTRPVVHWDAVAGELLTPGGELTRWRVHVGGSFTDVARSSPFYRSVETLLHRGVTAGCEVGARFCPLGTVTREQVAPFLLTASGEPGYIPVPCELPLFGDVPPASPFCSWIEELARRGITGGCAGGRYCPHDAVTREQTAVLLLRTLDPALNPPACTTPLFSDVPASSPFCRWIEELVRRGVTAGCGGGRYCPADPVTREQMAVFLTTTFGLTLYGP